jgi:hypothetical protein
MERQRWVRAQHRYGASGVLVEVNPRFYRAAEVDLLIDCAGKARDKLSWQPQTTLEDLCRMMAEADLARVGTDPYVTRPINPNAKRPRCWTKPLPSEITGIGSSFGSTRAGAAAPIIR